MGTLTPVSRVAAFTAPATALVVAQAADVLTTWAGLTTGHAEGNPAAAWLIASGGFGYFLLAKVLTTWAALAGAAALAARHTAIAGGVLAVLAVMVAGVAFSNLGAVVGSL